MSYPRFYLRTSKTFREDATVHYSMSLSRTEKIQSKTKIKVDSRCFYPHITDDKERKFIDRAKAKKLGVLKIAEKDEKKLQEVGGALLQAWTDMDKDDYENPFSVMRRQADIITGLKIAKYRNNKKKSLFEAFDEYITRQLKDKTPTSVRAYQHLERRLRAFEDFQGEALGFEDINDDFWEDLVEFISKKRTYKDEVFKPIMNNTLYTLNRRLAAVMNFAVARNYTDNTLYKLFSVKKEQITKIYLKPSDIELIERVELSGIQDQIRDIFLMCCYTGSRVGDVLSFTRENNTDVTVSGRPFLYWEQQKTGEIVSQEITNEIQFILDKYDGFPNEVNRIKYRDMSRYLKGIAEDAGVKQHAKVTSHTGRRSKVTNDRLVHKKSFEDIRKLLGHATIEQTMDYFKASPKDVLGQMKLEA